MITVDLDIKAVKDLQDSELAKVQQAIKDGLMATALYGQGYAQKSILRGKKTGHIYGRGAKLTKGKNKGKHRKYHQASAPGQPPANDTGFLASQIKAEVSATATMNNYTVELRSLAPYSIHLEYGTMHMAARPFLRPAGWQAGLYGEEIIPKYVKAATR